MDVATYKALRAEFERKRTEALGTASRMAAQIKDLDCAWKRLNGSDSEVSEGAVVLRNGTLVSKVCSAVDTLPETFESPDVWRAVLAANPGVQDNHGFRANVANALKGLVAEQRLELLIPGAGNRPARYRRVTAGQAEGGEAVSA